MQNARTVTLEYVFLKLRPFEVLISGSMTKSCLLYNFKTVQDIFMKLETNINQH